MAVRLRSPAILLLLLMGILAGPVMRKFFPDSSLAIDPDHLLKDLLNPIVGLSVGMILYEGGLTLRVRELRTGAKVITMLVTVGAFVTWLLATLAGVLIMKLPWGLALVFGAILTVTGPTVILPLVQYMRPKGATGPILRWEGIVIDPIGALLAVLVFEAVRAGGATSAANDVFYGVITTIIVGGGLGVVSGWLMTTIIKNYLVPDYLQNAVSFAMVVVTFALCDSVQKESGLLATTVMGVYLANQKSADVEHILEFKENLRVLLISSLFVVLAARLDLDEFRALGWSSVAFVAVLILVVRPVAVMCSTLGSRLNWRERALLASMAPRGIVAAAITPVLAFDLADRFPEQSSRIVPLMFAVIIGTVTFYSVVAPLIARLLKLADTNPQGVLILGGQPWARALGKTLKSLGVHAMIVDTNYSNTAAAWMEGVPAHHGSVMSEGAMKDIEMSGLGRFVALTPNDQVNTLSAQRMTRAFGRANVYRLPDRAAAEGEHEEHAEGEGRVLSNSKATYRAITALWAKNGGVQVTPLSTEYTLADFIEEHGENAVPMFVLNETNKLTVVSPKQSVTPQNGQRLISIMAHAAKAETEE
ncbi:MAG: sodium:proton antiporter [Phycisphaerales bacterium]|nr:sodium:proton antiporter [Phycisphaerales bacterium]MCB9835574.1 sodium:proton antiporter [Phycisphaera sp.]